MSTLQRPQTQAPQVGQQQLQQQQTNQSTLSKSANQFAVDLFQCYLKRHGDKYRNLLLCPYLIYHSLAMMLVGAKGNTAQQLHNLLRIPKQMPSSAATGTTCNSNQQKNASSSSSSSSSGKPSISPAARKGSSPLARSSCSSLSSNTSPRSPTPSSASSASSLGSVASGASRRSRSRVRKQRQQVAAVASNEQSLGKSRKLMPDGPDELRHREFLWLTEQLLHGNHDFVHLASFIYLDKTTKRTERFKNVLRDYYETKPKKVDFDNVDLMVKTVNEDVARTTENIYSDILSKQEAQKLEKSYMLLVNAVFFRGFWLSNFTDVRRAPFLRSKPQANQEQQVPSASPNLTGPQSAATLQQQQKPNGSEPSSNNRNTNNDLTVQLMSKLDYLPVVSDEQLDARIVMMPFEASDLQMLLILPNDKQSNSSYLCDRISAQKLEQVIEQFSRSKCKTVRVSMPIFCIDSGKISIQSTLVQMGASDLFDQKKANMNGVCENKQIWLNKILHRCFIICDNRGSITSLTSEKAKRRQAQLDSGMTSGRSGVDEFVADHPFMYIILDSVTKAILLIGLYTDPSETLEVIHENQLSPEEAHQIYTEGVYKT